MTNLTYDVVVVGAGPSGTTTAREAASRGASVLLLDRAKFPRDKPCGGGVTIRCANLLPFSIDPVVEDVVTGARLKIGNGREVVRDSKRVLTYMTQRRRLDAFLAERLVDAGFRGKYRAVAPQVPDPKLVRREITDRFPALDFDLIVLADRD